MSQPVPEAAREPSIIAVPAHVSSIIFGGGCGIAHVPLNGAVDCAACFPAAQGFIYPAAPAQEQSAAIATDVQPSPPAAVDASAPVAAAPAPDAPVDAPLKASKKPGADATSA